MKLQDLFEAKNHLGDPEYNTWSGWRAAAKKKNPEVWFEGDKDIAQAMVGPKPYKHGETKAIGEWDGEKGSIFSDKVAEARKPDGSLPGQKMQAARGKTLTLGKDVEPSKDACFVEFKLGFTYEKNDRDREGTVIVQISCDNREEAEKIITILKKIEDDFDEHFSDWLDHMQQNAFEGSYYAPGSAYYVTEPTITTKSKDGHKVFGTPAASFDRLAESTQHIIESWSNHKDGSFSADMSMVSHHKKDTGKDVTCPKCKEKLTMDMFAKHKDSEGDVKFWDLKHPCGAKLQIWNT